MFYICLCKIKDQGLDADLFRASDTRQNTNTYHIIIPDPWGSEICNPQNNPLSRRDLNPTEQLFAKRFEQRRPINDVTAGDYFMVTEHRSQ